MATGSVRYPDDASNTGPREATRTFTEDSVTKHLPRHLLEEPRIRTGMYYAHSGAFVLLASAHTAGNGFFWLINHVSSPSLIAVRRVRFSCQSGAATATPTSPRIVLERFTFTGTASGATVTAAKRRTTDATPSTWSMRTANTGMTQTPVAIVAGFFPIAAVTAVGVSDASVDQWIPEADEQCVLAAGEGLRCYQADAGTASDTRRGMMDILVDEFTDM